MKFWKQKPFGWESNIRLKHHPRFIRNINFFKLKAIPSISGSPLPEAEERVRERGLAKILLAAARGDSGRGCNPSLLVLNVIRELMYGSGQHLHVSTPNTSVTLVYENNTGPAHPPLPQFYRLPKHLLTREKRPTIRSPWLSSSGVIIHSEELLNECSQNPIKNTEFRGTGQRLASTFTDCGGMFCRLTNL